MVPLGEENDSRPWRSPRRRRGVRDWRATLDILPAWRRVSDSSSARRRVSSEESDEPHRASAAPNPMPRPCGTRFAPRAPRLTGFVRCRDPVGLLGSFGVVTLSVLPRARTTLRSRQPCRAGFPRPPPAVPGMSGAAMLSATGRVRCCACGRCCVPVRQRAGSTTCLPCPAQLLSTGQGVTSGDAVGDAPGRSQASSTACNASAPVIHRTPFGSSHTIPSGRPWTPAGQDPGSDRTWRHDAQSRHDA